MNVNKYMGLAFLVTCLFSPVQAQTIDAQCQTDTNREETCLNAGLRVDHHGPVPLLHRRVSIQGELLVTFKSDVSHAEAVSLLSSAGYVIIDANVPSGDNRQPVNKIVVPANSLISDKLMPSSFSFRIFAGDNTTAVRKNLLQNENIHDVERVFQSRNESRVHATDR